MDTAIIRNSRIIKLILILIVGFICIAHVDAASNPGQQRRTIVKRQINPTERHEIIVLIHGLIRTTFSMHSLKSYLEKQGYQVYSYSYPSSKFTIKQHGIYLNQFISRLLKDNPGVRVDFVTHSLGGIITREALSKLTPKQLKNIGCLIMLAPPNHGSQLAKLSTKMFPIFTSSIKPLAELSSDESSYVHRVPVPNIKIGVIAGRYDSKVPPAYARLDGQADYEIVNSTHTFIMDNSQTKKLIMNFLEKGKFR